MDVIEREVIFKGILSDIMEEIKTETDDQVKKEAGRTNRLAENKPQEVQDFGKYFQGLVTEITSFKRQIGSEKVNLIKTEFLLWYTLFHRPSGNPNAMVRKIMRTSNSDSGAVTNWKFGDSQGHQKPAWSLCSSRSCHLSGGM